MIRCEEKQAQAILLTGDYGALAAYLVPYVRAVTYKRTGRVDDDTVQDVLIKLLTGLHRYNPQISRLLSYVYRIVVNECYDAHGILLYEQYTCPQWEDQYDPAQIDQDDQDVDAGHLDRLRITLIKARVAGIYTVQQRHAVMIMLRYIRSGTFRFANYQDLADRMGVSLTTVQHVVKKTVAYVQGRPIKKPKCRKAPTKRSEYQRRYRLANLDRSLAYGAQYRADRKADQVARKAKKTGGAA